MPRPLVSSSATRAEALRLEQFVTDEGLEVVDIMAPDPAERVTVATNIAHKDRRRLEEYARRRGVKPAIILRALILGKLAADDE